MERTNKGCNYIISSSDLILLCRVKLEQMYQLVYKCRQQSLMNSRVMLIISGTSTCQSTTMRYTGCCCVTQMSNVIWLCSHKLVTLFKEDSAARQKVQVSSKVEMKLPPNVASVCHLFIQIMQCISCVSLLLCFVISIYRFAAPRVCQIMITNMLSKYLIIIM